MSALLARTTLALLLAALVLSVGPTPAASIDAAVTPVAVSPADARDHYGPDVAALSGGGAVVVWQATAPASGAAAATSEAPGSEIFGRLLTTDGAPVGAPFRVNAALAGEQRRPAVAALPDGGFIVAWDINTRAVWARRFGPSGTPRDAADLVVAPDAGFDPDVVALPDSGFVIAWERNGATASEVLLRRFGPDGAPTGAATLPTPTGTVSRMNPALAASPAGALALVWEEPGAIRLTRLSATGETTHDAILVVSSSGAELRDPAVAFDVAGVAAVAWASRPPANPAASRVDLRRLDAVGKGLGPVVTLSAAGAAERAAPALSIGRWGALAAWADLATTKDGVVVGLAARALDSESIPVGDERYPRLPLAATEPVGVVAVAATAGGAWVVWSQERIGEGTDRSAVYTRRILADSSSVYLPILWVACLRQCHS